MNLNGKVLFITGASRGIGLAIALRAARDGARVAVVAKTTQPHPHLSGTIYTAAQQISDAGGQALPIACDIRDDEQIAAAVAKTVEAFGAIDICINNASAIDLAPTADITLKKLELLQQINVRGTFLVTRYCLTHLLRADNPHVLNLSPPLPIETALLGTYPAYSQTKFSMSFFAAAMAHEYREQGIAFNTLWPQTTIATAAIELVAPEHLRRSRKPEVMADAAHWILTQPASVCTGRHFIDEEVLIGAGVTDLTPYRVTAGTEVLATDLFVRPSREHPGIRY